MPEVTIPPKSNAEAAVVSGGVTLFKSGQQITVSPDAVAALQNEGWLPFQADLKGLANEVRVWAATLGETASVFAQVVNDDGVIDPAEGAQLDVMVKAMVKVAEAYNRLYLAASVLHPISQPAGDDAAPAPAEEA